MVRMAEYSRATLRAMRADLGIQYDHLERGILNFYRDPQEFENSQRAAGLMRDFGVERRVVSADEVIAIEPALAPHRYHRRRRLRRKTKAATCTCSRSRWPSIARGPASSFATTPRPPGCSRPAATLQGVELIDPDGRYGTLSADAYVVAMGSFSPAMLRPLGIPCNVYPAKGYSATFPIVRPDAAPVVSLTDSSHKIVFSRLGTGCAWPARQSCRAIPVA